MSLNETTSAPRAAWTAGVDWAKDDYAVCVVDLDGRPRELVTLRYTKAGLRRLAELLDRHGVVACHPSRRWSPVRPRAGPGPTTCVTAHAGDHMAEVTWNAHALRPDHHRPHCERDGASAVSGAGPAGCRAAARLPAGRLVCKGGREPESGQDAAVEAGHGTDPGARKGKDHQPDGVEAAGLRVAGVEAKSGLAVGPRR